MEDRDESLTALALTVRRLVTRTRESKHDRSFRFMGISFLTVS